MYEIKKKVKKVKIISEKKILKPYFLENCQTDLDSILKDWGNKLLSGAEIAQQHWINRYNFRKFPVHYYGIGNKLGIAFSDLGIFWAYAKLAHLLGKTETEQLLDTSKKVIISELNDYIEREQPSGGLLNGLSGTCWLLDQLGEEDLAQKYMNDNFQKMIQNCKGINLYEGLAGILLTGAYFLNKQK